MSDSNEIYYAEMEAARNSAEDAYFVARPRPDISPDQDAADRVFFRAGFERAFALLWHGGRAVQETSPDPATCPDCCQCDDPDHM